ASVAEVLSRLTTLSQELAGAFRPATIVEVVARTLTEQLAPGRLSVLLLDLDANRLTVAYHNGPRPATTDEPLLQLALRRGPLVFPDRVAARAAELGATVDRPTPSSWLGVPINAGSRTIGAIALESDRSKALDDGALMFARAVVAQAGIATDEPGAAVLMFDDQTEKRRLQEQLLQSEKMSAIGQLIAGVAHDLNNPLASVVGFSDLLGEAPDVPPRLAEPLAVIRQEAERASAIVRNLLSFARRQEGERQLHSIR